MKPNLILTLALLFFYSCTTNNDRAQKEISANFYLRYLEDGQELKAEATFLEKDSLGRSSALEMDGGVSFLGSAMGFRKLSESIFRYNYENIGGFPEQITFGCQPEAGQERILFQTTMTTLNRYTLPDTLANGAPLVVVMPEGPMSKDETLVMILSNEDREAFSVTVKGPSDGNAMVIPPAKLSELDSGAYEVYLVKKQNQKKSIQNIEGIIEVEYYSKSTDLYIAK